MEPWELRERRRKAGLTLRQVAAAAGTAETNVAAYERGVKTPSARTTARLLAVLGAGSKSPIHSQGLLTVPAAAAAIRSGLRTGATTAELLRIVREMRTHARLLSTAAERKAFFTAPSTTGDPRWDAMLAGVVEDWALTHGMRPPAWSRGHSLPRFWFVGESPSLQAYAFAHSPMSLQVRGVLVDPGDLEAV
ncbi:MAG: helix-turn-helix transcriptional regulator [Frankiaceae bacterium]|nr:helix-turn-helix transcriptional regulator [Frankiaceae bacterium]MBV9368301.1 helix-turn-helix transcriptional regulator [Frankiales bacterium]